MREIEGKVGDKERCSVGRRKKEEKEGEKEGWGREPEKIHSD